MNENSKNVPQLVALDWGTSSLRAFLMQKGQVLETRHSAHGIQHLPAPGSAGYEQAFGTIAGDWVAQWPDTPIVACGMVGSAQGWKEAPYVRCPADIRKLADKSVSVPSGLGPNILIAPGVLFDQPDELPDVMRGEEIQIAGALLTNPQWAGRACMLLPGTHSKWALIENGKIVRYATYLTGELYAVLCHHSILGRLMPGTHETETHEAAFELGLTEARRSGPGDLSHQIFGTRTLGLAGRLPHAALADYLSGLLIGHEIVSGLAHAGDLGAMPLVMIGAPALCQRYQQALQYLGKTVDSVMDNTAPIGLWHLASAAGLIDES